MASSKVLEAVTAGKQALAKFRATNPDVLLDLTEVDLKGADLRGMNLRRALLVGAKLARADLTGANLNEADLTRAGLKRATLVRADLRRANLFKAMLGEADASDADFGRANLNSSDLTNAKLTRASFLEADFNKAQLSEANVLGADFSLARFAGTHASKLVCGWTRWSNCDLHEIIGLDTAVHHGPSSIGLDSWLKSRGQIPPEFLRGSGLPDDFVAALQTTPREAAACFVRFSHEDLSFAERLAQGLRSVGLVCWLDEMPDAGRNEPPLEAQFDSQQPNKVIFLASRSSLTSPWVEGEVARLLKREEHWKRDVGQEVKLLLPLTLDGFLFGGDAKGKPDKAIAARVVADFNGWRRNDTKFDEVFPKVLIALGAEPRKPEVKVEGGRSPFAWFSRKKDDDDE
ncbi:MAG: toll/interleukin-1 receptor domain-containing protein [Planctomycetaceae bacterium]